jgi:hypothetical protein
MENMSSMPLFMPKRHLSKIYMLLSNLKRSLSKTIFISYHVMCSLLSCCCNHLNIMLMSVKLIMIQLELIGIGYKLKFYSYSKFTSNKWYTLICKFEKCKPNPKIIMGMNIYCPLNYLFFFKLKKKLNIEIKEIEKKNHLLEF